MVNLVPHNYGKPGYFVKIDSSNDLSELVDNTDRLFYIKNIAFEQKTIRWSNVQKEEGVMLWKEKR